MGTTIIMRIFCLLVLVCFCHAIHYEPNWKSIDSRPLPSWYDEGKIGIFLHWGVFSVPSFSSEWFWEQWETKNPSVVKFMKENYRPDFTYADFAPMYQAEFYSPERWTEIFKASGARYVVLVTKHHEGFTNWPSKYSWNWNAMDSGPHRDLVGDFANAIKKNSKIHFGVYHSLFEWFNPLFLEDQKNLFQTNEFVMRKTLPELHELVNTYKPDVVWSDGDWMAPDWYWNATDFLAWLYNDSPVKDTVVVNDRWGSNARCKHGGFFNCNDKFNPGKLFPHKWENAMSIDRGSWGYRRTAHIEDLYTIEALIALLAETISCGGNLLINVGPTSYGVIAPIYEERLRQLGQWLNVNGEAIYESKPWKHQNDTITPKVWYTYKMGVPGEMVFAIVLFWPDNTLLLGAPQITANTRITMVGYPQAGDLNYKPGPSGGVQIDIPVIPASKMPCEWAWIFRLTGLKN